jgi:hypothetical protein
MQVLGREERSLAHLLRRYCGVLQDKTHQTADWRVRPLPKELQTYARSDVHWLPYLAGVMVSEMQARSPSNTGVSLLLLWLWLCPTVIAVQFWCVLAAVWCKLFLPDGLYCKA